MVSLMVQGTAYTRGRALQQQAEGTTPSRSRQGKASPQHSLTACYLRENMLDKEGCLIANSG